MKVFRVIFGFIVGFICYAAFFWIGLFAGGLFGWLQGLLDRHAWAEATAVIVSALAANLGSFFIFEKISGTESPFPKISYCVILIVFAVLFLIGVILSQKWYLILYSIVSFVSLGYKIRSIIKEQAPAPSE